MEYIEGKELRAIVGAENFQPLPIQTNSLLDRPNRFRLKGVLERPAR
jgi:hypothetical protein